MDLQSHVNCGSSTPREGSHLNRKFDLSTPNRGAKACLQVLNPVKMGGVPSSKLIIQDVEKVLRSVQTIRQAKGIKIDGLVNRKGKRDEGPDRETCGGKRVKKDEPTWLQGDARRVKLETSKKRFVKKRRNLQKKETISRIFVRQMFKHKHVFSFLLQ